LKKLDGSWEKESDVEGEFVLGLHAGYYLVIFVLVNSKRFERFID
jgi:hypothetical protein